MLRIVATALLSFLLLAGHYVRAAEPAQVMNFSCSGTQKAKGTRRPVKSYRRILVTSGVRRQLFEIAI